MRPETPATCVERVFTFGKHPNQANEDAVACRAARGLYAVSDGASTSFEASKWAEILVTRFLRNSRIDREWVAAAAREFSEFFNSADLPWYVEEALERGSFATLLGVRIMRSRHKIQVVAIGNSVAFLCDGNQLVSSWPYTKAEQFNEQPIFFQPMPIRTASLA